MEREEKGRKEVKGKEKKSRKGNKHHPPNKFLVTVFVNSFSTCTAGLNTRHR